MRNLFWGMTITGAAAALVCSPNQAAADASFIVDSDEGVAESPPVVGRSPADTRPGTHFVAELYGGAMVGGGVGAASALTLGVGGKPPTFPWRFYLIGVLGYHSQSSEGGFGDPHGFVAEDRSWFDMGIGLRTYVPVVHPVRLFVDVVGGANHASATVERLDFATVDESSWEGLFSAGVGLQLRLWRELSAGARIAYRFTGDPLSGLRENLGIHDTLPLALSAGVTWHL